MSEGETTGRPEVILSLRTGILQLRVKGLPRAYLADDGQVVAWPGKVKVIKSEPGQLKTRQQILDEGRAFAIKHGYTPVPADRNKKKPPRHGVKKRNPDKQREVWNDEEWLNEQS